jgi:N-acetylmuramoyl-L-alanine amidase
VFSVPPPPLICLDPGHGTIPGVGRQTEPIGPGSSQRKIKDGGGAPGEARVALAIALKTRALLQRDGYRVAMTRTGPTYAGGNIKRARFCNVRRAALMVRIHADGSASTSARGIKTLVPALRQGWTDDIYAASLAAGRKVQAAVVRQTGALNLGVVFRSDLTGFNWANVPAILVETGLMTNPNEGRLLRTPAYQLRIARGIAVGTKAFLAARARRALAASPAACRLSTFTVRRGSILTVSPFVARVRDALRHY